MVNGATWPHLPRCTCQVLCLSQVKRQQSLKRPQSHDVILRLHAMLVAPTSMLLDPATDPWTQELKFRSDGCNEDCISSIFSRCFTCKCWRGWRGWPDLFVRSRVLVVVLHLVHRIASKMFVVEWLPIAMVTGRAAATCTSMEQLMSGVVQFILSHSSRFGELTLKVLGVYIFVNAFWFEDLERITNHLQFRNFLWLWEKIACCTYNLHCGNWFCYISLSQMKWPIINLLTNSFEWVSFMSVAWLGSWLISYSSLVVGGLLYRVCTLQVTASLWALFGSYAYKGTLPLSCFTLWLFYDKINIYQFIIVLIAYL